MFKNLFFKFKSILRSKNNENIKEVLEDLIVDNGKNEQKFDDGTKNIFKNVINISDKCIEDVMIPRADIDAVSAEITFSELISYIDKTKHSRMPVYENNLDKVVGMIHIRDLFKKMSENVKVTKKGKVTKKIMRNILFSSPSMKILDLLLKMRSEQIHMSIVVDEFGGTNGLVTIEDLVEEIVGEIKDEHDFEEMEEVKKVSKKTFEVSARVTIEDFERKIGISFKDDQGDEIDEIDTLGGLVFYLLGRIPERGEVINYKSGLEFTILDADTRKIKRILVTVK
tara:strand:+ start:514 stop:1362 length:849 start_codon:yes stop_codon:yes gene_type:complete